MDSWGLLHHSKPSDCQYLQSGQFLQLKSGLTYIPYGNGRCYGDECFNDSAGVIFTKYADHFLDFDESTGVLTVEAGVLLATILEVMLPRGWFLPVVPGTQFITVGGAIANDVHGKNQHVQGSFGNHVLGFLLQRSDGNYWCSEFENQNLFASTLGGAGLTGLVTQAKIQLMPVTGPWLQVKNIRFSNLKEFFILSEVHTKDYEYSVAWIDCLAQKDQLGRGWLFLGKHLDAKVNKVYKAKQKSYPLRQKFSFVNPYSLKLFNQFYYHRPLKKEVISHYQPFFFPLDGLKDWNRMYGARGFYQYQCLIPSSCAYEGIYEILERISKGNMGSFLAVLKMFGNVSSKGWLSFCSPGVTLALDFPNTGASSLKLFDELDLIVERLGGRLYLAKDARMSASSFRNLYPRWQDFQKYIDPKFSSNMARRLELVTSLEKDV